MKVAEVINKLKKLDFSNLKIYSFPKEKGARPLFETDKKNFENEIELLSPNTTYVFVLDDKKQVPVTIEAEAISGEDDYDELEEIWDVLQEFKDTIERHEQWLLEIKQYIEKNASKNTDVLGKAFDLILNGKPTQTQTQEQLQVISGGDFNQIAENFKQKGYDLNQIINDLNKLLNEKPQIFQAAYQQLKNL
jgi:hypothetical protein